jgi:hypothetical protein
LPPVLGDLASAADPLFDRDSFLPYLTALKRTIQQNANVTPIIVWDQSLQIRDETVSIRSIRNLRSPSLFAVALPLAHFPLLAPWAPGMHGPSKQTQATRAAPRLRHITSQLQPAELEDNNLLNLRLVFESIILYPHFLSSLWCFCDLSGLDIVYLSVLRPPIVSEQTRHRLDVGYLYLILFTERELAASEA